MRTRSILLGFATRFGSTQEIAETVSATLRAAGLEVELLPTGVGLLNPMAERVNHGAVTPPEPVPAATTAYGKYLSVICMFR